LIFSSTARRDDVKDFIDQIVVRNAWLASKANFISTLNINARSDYISYEQWWFRRFHLHNYINCLRGHKLNMFPEEEEFVMHNEELNAAPERKAFHRQKLEECDEWNDYDLENMNDLLYMMFETDLDIRAAYMNELELII
jgi:hypothetical protein